MRHKWLLIALLVVVVLGLAFLAGVVSFFASGTRGGSSLSILSDKKIGVVNLEGTITDSAGLIEDLEEARKDTSVASVVLRIDSPGGAVGASQEMFEAVRKLAKEKPVVASMGSVAASGGYYVALGATRILANPATVTGSIGVRLDHVMLADLLKWAKINHETLKSGKFKDMGSFDRPMLPEERGLLEESLADIHEQFKEVVAEARHLPREQVDALADGRIYTGRRALELGLVDAIGGYLEAVRVAAELGGVKGEPEIIHPGDHGSFFTRLFEEARSAIQTLSTRTSYEFWRPMLLSVPARAPVY